MVQCKNITRREYDVIGKLNPQKKIKRNKKLDSDAEKFCSVYREIKRLIAATITATNELLSTWFASTNPFH